MGHDRGAGRVAVRARLACGGHAAQHHRRHADAVHSGDGNRARSHRAADRHHQQRRNRYAGRCLPRNVGVHRRRGPRRGSAGGRRPDVEGDGALGARCAVEEHQPSHRHAAGHRRRDQHGDRRGQARRFGEAWQPGAVPRRLRADDLGHERNARLGRGADQRSQAGAGARGGPRPVGARDRRVCGRACRDQGFAQHGAREHRRSIRVAHHGDQSGALGGPGDRRRQSGTGQWRGRSGRRNRSGLTPHQGGGRPHEGERGRRQRSPGGDGACERGHRAGRGTHDGARGSRGRDQALGRLHSEDREDDRRDRIPDESTGAERRGGSGTGRRRRQGLRRRGRRSA